MKGKAKYINYIILILSLGLVILFVMQDAENLSKLPEILGNTTPIYLIFALLCMVFFWVLEIIVQHMFTKSLYRKQDVKNSIKVSMIGQFYNCVTPFASGGQPMQVYYLSKNGVPVGVATTALVAKFIIYQLTLIIYSSVAIIFRLNFFTTNISGFVYLAVLGFLINFFVITFCFTAAYFNTATKKIINFFFKVISAIRIGKFRLVKDPSALVERIETEVNNFTMSFAMVRKQRGLLIKTFLLSVVQLTVLMIIPFILFLAFNPVGGVDIVTMISAQVLVTMISSFVPIPGASGAAEGSFYIFFHMFFGAATAVAMLIWRFITYYFTIIVGGIFVMRAGVGGKNPEVVAEQNITDNSE